MRVRPFKRGQRKAGDKVKALRAGQAQRSGGWASHKREKKRAETYVKATPSGEVRLRLNVMTGD